MKAGLKATERNRASETERERERERERGGGDQERETESWRGTPVHCRVDSFNSFEASRNKTRKILQFCTLKIGSSRPTG